MPFAITIPTSNTPINITLENGTSTVFVGANGSGKTRLALHIENQIGETAHRISAHRALTLNPGVPKISEKEALGGLKFGYGGDQAALIHRTRHRWGGNPATSLLNDFDSLIQALFAEQSRTALQTHNNARDGVAHTAQATKFERLKNIWQALIPHRRLVVNGDDIQAQASENGPLYSAAELSDGERAVFYLVGQVLVAAENSLLVVDEPELHVHRSIMNSLWDQLEIARPDCTFLFITHDLEFAASRIGSKFVIRDYMASPNARWTIEVVPEDTGFSEDIATLLLGSRRPILFVEGDRNSLDMAVFRCVYPQWTVVPRGSCQDVIHAVVTLRTNAAFTRISCAGIVDADDFDESDVNHLRQLSIFILPVSEIENLFLLPEISREIARTEHLSDPEIDARLVALADEILDIANQTDIVEPAVRRYCLRRIDRFLKKTDLSQTGSIAEISDAYDAKVLNFDVAALAQHQRDRISGAFIRRDLAAFLSLIDNKGMIARAASRLKNTNREAFEAWLIRALHMDRTPHLVTALLRALPEIDIE